MKTTIIILTLLLIVSGVFNYSLLKFKQSVSKHEIINKIIIDKTNYESVLQHIREHEFFMPKAYQMGNHWYIGYGHQIHLSQSYLYNGITEEHAEKLMKQDLMHCILWANDKYQVYSNQALAVGMLMYRIGCSRVEGSHIHKMLMKQKNGESWSVQDKKDFDTAWLSYSFYEGKKHVKMMKRCIFENKLFYAK